MPPADTFFTAAPHWSWLVIIYFFLGGIAGGCYFVAALIDLFGRASDRPLARLAYRIALPAVAVCGILLIVDLGRPERFWHMLLQSGTWRPMFKSYSPMSFGAFFLLSFFFFSFLSFFLPLFPPPLAPWIRPATSPSGPATGSSRATTPPAR